MDSSTNEQPSQSQDRERDEAPNDIRKEYDHNIEKTELEDITINAAAGSVNEYNQDSGPHQEVGTAAGTSAKTSLRLYETNVTNGVLNTCGGNVNTFGDGVPVRVDDSSGGGKVKTLIKDGKMTKTTLNFAGRNINTIGTKK